MSRAESSQCLSPQREQGAWTGCIQCQRDLALSRHHWVQEMIHTGVKRLSSRHLGSSEKDEREPWCPYSDSCILMAHRASQFLQKVPVKLQHGMDISFWMCFSNCEVAPLPENMLTILTQFQALCTMSYVFYLIFISFHEWRDRLWKLSEVKTCCAQARKSQTSLLKSLPQTLIYYF